MEVVVPHELLNEVKRLCEVVAEKEAYPRVIQYSFPREDGGRAKLVVQHPTHYYVYSIDPELTEQHVGEFKGYRI